jgi:hypothetical protein
MPNNDSEKIAERNVGALGRQLDAEIPKVELSTDVMIDTLITAPISGPALRLACGSFGTQTMGNERRLSQQTRRACAEQYNYLVSRNILGKLDGRCCLACLLSSRRLNADLLGLGETTCVRTPQ